MHKQRSKRVGMNKSAEARRKHYEKIMERQSEFQVEGPGKAYAGSKRNKKQVRKGGVAYSARKDWYTLHVTQEQFAELPHNVPGVVIDAGQCRKPNHKARAINIVDAFTLPHHKADEQAKTMLDKLKERFAPKMKFTENGAQA